MLLGCWQFVLANSIKPSNSPTLKWRRIIRQFPGKEGSSLDIHACTHTRTHTHTHVHTYVRTYTHTHKHFHLLCLIKCWSNKNNLSLLSPILIFPLPISSFPFLLLSFFSSFFPLPPPSSFSSLPSPLPPSYLLLPLLPPPPPTSSSSSFSPSSPLPLLLAPLPSQVLMIDPDTPADVIRKAYRKVMKD